MAPAALSDIAPGLLVAALAAIALVSPVFAGEGTAQLIALLLIGAGLLECWHGFRRADARRPARRVDRRRHHDRDGGAGVQRRSAGGNGHHRSAGGLVRPRRDPLRRSRAAKGDYAGRTTDWLLPALGNLAAMAILVFALRRRARLDARARRRSAHRRHGVEHRVVARLHGDATPGETALAQLGLPDEPELSRVADRIEDRREARASARPRLDLGLHRHAVRHPPWADGLRPVAARHRSPLVAVIGDLFLALVIAFAVVIPLRPGVSQGSPVVSSDQAWRWCLADAARGLSAGAGSPVRAALECVGSGSRCVCAARGTRRRTALSRGLQIGLPLAAIIAAIVPVFGMSWFFDTENWAAGMWNSWAEARTDTWREAMVKATFERREGEESQPSGTPYSPPGVDGGRRLLVPRDRRPRRGGCVAARPAGPDPRRDGARRGEVRRDLVGRHLPDGRDEGLRATTSGCR